LTSPLWLREEKDNKKYVFKDEETTSTSGITKDNISDETQKTEIPKPRKKTQIRRPDPCLKLENSSEMVFNTFKQWWTKDSIAFLNGSCEVSKLEEMERSNALSQAASTLLESPCMKKVQAFYNGTTDIDLSSSVKEIHLEEREPVLPQIDKRAQRFLRRSIVLEGFQKAFDSISDLIELKWTVICNPAKDLVSTFNLTADNIVLRPNGWMLATGILIHCLSIRAVSLKSNLEQPFFKQLFSKVNYDGKHVSIFVDELMNLE